MTTTLSRPLSTALTTLLLVAASAAAGCNLEPLDLCGDNPTHEEQRPSCSTGGGARIEAPARWNLPRTAPNVYGATCLDGAGGCTSQPFVTFDSGSSDAHPQLTVQIFFPHGVGTGVYDLPSAITDTPQPYGNATLWPPGDGVPEDLEFVEGTIKVTRANPDDFRATFALTLRSRSTGETVTLNSTDAEVDCELETVTVCDGDGWGLISPY
jgi:hypothetical protein